MPTIDTTAASLGLLLLLAACDGPPPPPPPPPPPSDAGRLDAGRFDAGRLDDAGGVDGGSFDAALHDGGADAAADAAPFDAGPPPAGGPFADLVVSGARSATERLVPPANQVRCDLVGTNSLYVGLSVDPAGLSGETFEIDVAGPMVVGPYTPRTGRTRPGSFGMLYRASLFVTYGIDAASTPCAFEVTALGGGVLEASFDCRELKNLNATAAPRLNVRGFLRCDYP